MLAQAPTSTVTKRIIELFFSRTDVAALQWYSPARSVGGYAKICQSQPPWGNIRCVHHKQGQKCAGCADFQPVPVTERLIEMHLANQVTLGSYQLGLDRTSVKWAVLDVDDHGEGDPAEMQDTVRTIHMALADLNLPASLEASGGKGWRCHLWVFFNAPVPAIKVRTVLDYALDYCGRADRPYIERFPKQSRALNGYGNLVKIPFGKHQKTGNRSCFLDPETLEPMPSVRAALDSIQEVDPIVIDSLIDFRHLTVSEQAPGEAQPAKNFDYPAEEMRRVLERCWYFRELERQQMGDKESVHYEDWWNYVLMFSRFGDAGARRILAFSELDERYDEEYTINIINYIRQHGYHMPSCRRLRAGPGLVHCPFEPLDCGAI